MSTSDTPETDSRLMDPDSDMGASAWMTDSKDGAYVLADFARQLERERNNLRAEIASMRSELTATLDACPHSVRVCEGLGPENMLASVAATLAEFKAHRATAAKLADDYLQLSALVNATRDERDELRARVAELETARGEPGVWLRDQRDDYEGPETLDPMYFIGAANPGRGAHGATYSPFYAAPQTAKGDPVAWMYHTRKKSGGIRAAMACVTPPDLWMGSKVSDDEELVQVDPLYTGTPAVDVDKISDDRIQCGSDAYFAECARLVVTGEQSADIYRRCMRAALRAIHNNGGGE